MKISYKVLKDYIPDIKSPEEVAKWLVMHTAEVEDIISGMKNFEAVLTWKLVSYEKVEWSDKLHVGQFDFWIKWIIQIVFGSVFGLKIWEVYPIALAPTVLPTGIEIKKSKLCWVTSNWMVCADEELWTNFTNEWLIRLPENTPLWIHAINIINKWEPDSILEIDNKAINHRPDLFSHIWVIREIYAINWKKFDFEYECRDFSNLPSLWIKNEIQKEVKRYIWLKIENVANIESPEYIKKVLNSAEINSKGLLIDISNYSLYLYWQPTHCFDADKIKWNITIRYAKSWEKFIALNENTYDLSDEDIVIADDEKVLALWWIIGWKESSVSNETKNIIVEWAHFNQAIIRKTWKRLWIRTDSLNVFEKDILPEMAIRWVSLIASELEKNIKWLIISWYSDIYSEKQLTIKIPFDLEYINNLIGKNYSKEVALNILNNLWITVDSGKSSKWKIELIVPFWRKDLSFKSDIAEEIARIDWYDNIESTIPKINIWAVIQTNVYKLKNDSRNFFTDKWYYDMYTYSFVNEGLMSKVLWNTTDLVPMKNPLSEELSHLRWSIIPNLLLSIEKNDREFDRLRLFEIEKVFKRNWNEINEHYSLSWVEVSNKDIVYYDVQNTISDLLKTVWVDRYMYDNCDVIPTFAHRWRTASIIVRWEVIWTVWEIHPKVANNFEINTRIWYFEIDIEKLEKSLYGITKAKELSNYQENNFDLSFVVDKTIKTKDIKITIEKSNQNLITKVELVDIYEDEIKLPWKRSLSFKIYIQSMEWTLDDKIKNELINEIVNKVGKKGWVLR